MSVGVDLARLQEEMGSFGSTPFLLTVGDDLLPHATSVHVRWEDHRLVARAGRRSSQNASARPGVTLLFPPVEPGGYSLLVDGTAVVDGDGDDRVVAVSPTHAILHRSAQSGPDGPARNDCAPVAADNR
jgi:hypothetical protein